MKQLLSNIYEMAERIRLENEKANKEAKRRTQTSKQKVDSDKFEKHN